MKSSRRFLTKSPPRNKSVPSCETSASRQFVSSLNIFHVARHPIDVILRKQPRPITNRGNHSKPRIHSKDRLELARGKSDRQFNLFRTMSKQFDDLVLVPEDQIQHDKELIENLLPFSRQYSKDSGFFSKFFPKKEVEVTPPLVESSDSILSLQENNNESDEIEKSIEEDQNEPEKRVIIELPTNPSENTLTDNQNIDTTNVTDQNNDNDKDNTLINSNIPEITENENKQINYPNQPLNNTENQANTSNQDNAKDEKSQNNQNSSKRKNSPKKSRKKSPDKSKADKEREISKTLKKQIKSKLKSKKLSSQLNQQPKTKTTENKTKLGLKLIPKDKKLKKLRLQANKHNKTIEPTHPERLSSIKSRNITEFEPTQNNETTNIEETFVDSGDLTDLNISQISSNHRIPNIQSLNKLTDLLNAVNLEYFAAQQNQEEYSFPHSKLSQNADQNPLSNVNFNFEDSKNSILRTETHISNNNLPNNDIKAEFIHDFKQDLEESKNFIPQIDLIGDSLFQKDNYQVDGPTSNQKFPDTEDNENNFKISQNWQYFPDNDIQLEQLRDEFLINDQIDADDLELIQDLINIENGEFEDKFSTIESTHISDTDLQSRAADLISKYEAKLDSKITYPQNNQELYTDETTNAQFNENISKEGNQIFSQYDFSDLVREQKDFLEQLNAIQCIFNLSPIENEDFSKCNEEFISDTHNNIFSNEDDQIITEDQKEIHSNPDFDEIQKMRQTLNDFLDQLSNQNPDQQDPCINLYESENIISDFPKLANSVDNFEIPTISLNQNSMNSDQISECNFITSNIHKISENDQIIIDSKLQNTIPFIDFTSFDENSADQLNFEQKSSETSIKDEYLSSLPAVIVKPDEFIATNNDFYEDFNELQDSTFNQHKLFQDIEEQMIENEKFNSIVANMKEIEDQLISSTNSIKDTFPMLDLMKQQNELFKSELNESNSFRSDNNDLKDGEFFNHSTMNRHNLSFKDKSGNKEFIRHMERNQSLIDSFSTVIRAVESSLDISTRLQNDSIPNIKSINDIIVKTETILPLNNEIKVTIMKDKFVNFKLTENQEIKDKFTQILPNIDSQEDDELIDTFAKRFIIKTSNEELDNEFLENYEEICSCLHENEELIDKFTKSYMNHKSNEELIYSSQGNEEMIDFITRELLINESLENDEENKASFTNTFLQESDELIDKYTKQFMNNKSDETEEEIKDNFIISKAYENNEIQDKFASVMMNNNISGFNNSKPYTSNEIISSENNYEFEKIFKSLENNEIQDKFANQFINYDSQEDEEMIDKFAEILMNSLSNQNEEIVDQVTLCLSQNEFDEQLMKENNLAKQKKIISREINLNEEEDEDESHNIVIRNIDYIYKPDKEEFQKTFLSEFNVSEGNHQFIDEFCNNSLRSDTFEISRINEESIIDEFSKEKQSYLINDEDNYIIDQNNSLNNTKSFDDEIQVKFTNSANDVMLSNNSHYQDISYEKSQHQFDNEELPVSYQTNLVSNDKNIRDNYINNENMLTSNNNFIQIQNVKENELLESQNNEIDNSQNYHNIRSRSISNESLSSSNQTKINSSEFNISNQNIFNISDINLIDHCEMNFSDITNSEFIECRIKQIDEEKEDNSEEEEEDIVDYCSNIQIPVIETEIKDETNKTNQNNLYNPQNEEEFIDNTSNKAFEISPSLKSILSFVKDETPNNKTQNEHGFIDNFTNEGFTDKFVNNYAFEDKIHNQSFISKGSNDLEIISNSIIRFDKTDIKDKSSRNIHLDEISSNIKTNYTIYNISERNIVNDNLFFDSSANELSFNEEGKVPSNNGDSDISLFVDSSINEIFSNEENNNPSNVQSRDISIIDNSNQSEHIDIFNLQNNQNILSEILPNEFNLSNQNDFVNKFCYFGNCNFFAFDPDEQMTDSSNDKVDPYHQYFVAFSDEYFFDPYAKTAVSSNSEFIFDTQNIIDPYAKTAVSSNSEISFDAQNVIDMESLINPSNSLVNLEVLNRLERNQDLILKLAENLTYYPSSAELLGTAILNDTNIMDEDDIYIDNCNIKNQQRNFKADLIHSLTNAQQQDNDLRITPMIIDLNQNNLSKFQILDKSYKTNDFNDENNQSIENYLLNNLNFNDIQDWCQIRFNNSPIYIKNNDIVVSDETIDEEEFQFEERSPPKPSGLSTDIEKETPHIKFGENVSPVKNFWESIQKTTSKKSQKVPPPLLINNSPLSPTKKAPPLQTKISQIPAPFLETKISQFTPPRIAIPSFIASPMIREKTTPKLEKPLINHLDVFEELFPIEKTNNEFPKSHKIPKEKLDFGESTKEEFNAEYYEKTLETKKETKRKKRTKTKKSPIKNREINQTLVNDRISQTSNKELLDNLKKIEQDSNAELLIELNKIEETSIKELVDNEEIINETEIPRLENIFTPQKQKSIQSKSMNEADQSSISFQTFFSSTAFPISRRNPVVNKLFKLIIPEIRELENPAEVGKFVLDLSREFMTTNLVPLTQERIDSTIIYSFELISNKTIFSKILANGSLNIENSTFNIQETPINNKKDSIIIGKKSFKFPTQLILDDVMTNIKSVQTNSPDFVLTKILKLLSSTDRIEDCIYSPDMILATTLLSFEGIDNETVRSIYDILVSQNYWNYFLRILICEEISSATEPFMSLTLSNSILVKLLQTFIAEIDEDEDYLENEKIIHLLRSVFIISNLIYKENVASIKALANFLNLANLEKINNQNLFNMIDNWITMPIVLKKEHEVSVDVAAINHFILGNADKVFNEISTFINMKREDHPLVFSVYQNLRYILVNDYDINCPFAIHL
ncbi:hypothetical protein TVAG_120410 [Trichomonas vaginalis G3]|uniref:Uncharacterized protein n=1 Tax=Trichomonas vaginalis (strain ATCC PRA-98 / G3) TaxID=412133 RepID=A2D7I6_TRIV3|nr:hypothetical protein TVAGG3_0993440 [Trichomonas vaginalis G3]EAY23703.1 hypothetical protein TVAG_120410 [Trichomonas vaginalis G3]KAI5490198.1 hypothetical protein TVAGG3_0993440 [Trichomonas vaginalis G3]|eukprot:XP_001276951.1 hypothetical protein [Trichomonas vaginalis G3]